MFSRPAQRVADTGCREMGNAGDAAVKDDLTELMEDGSMGDVYQFVRRCRT